jgi:phosphoribosyl-dephospho-CoA transferase
MTSRHDLVWLGADGWRAALAGADARHGATMARWRDADWPLIVTRQPPDALPGTVALGLAAPSRVRIALSAREADIARHASPPLLSTVLSQTPAEWEEGLTELNGACPEVRVFGSFTLQALTGQQYLSERSDVDLLFYPRTREALDFGLERFASAATSLPVDGEVIFPGGGAVSWKEWQSVRGTGSKVLVKHVDSVSLMAPEQLLAELTP